MRIPVVIQEQNLFPGFTNRILGRFAKKIAVSFEDSKEFFPEERVVVTGNPVRREILERLEEKKEEEKKPRFTIFIFGGSQGAEIINRAFVSALDHLGGIKDSIKIVHQTGRRDEEWIKDEYEKGGFFSDVRPFIHEIVEMYKEADLIICRAGATTVSELLVTGRASILIPLPTSAHNHQEMNARRLQDKGAAEMILEKDLTGEVLAKKIIELMRDKKRLEDMGTKGRGMAITDAAERIVDICYSVIEEKKKSKAMNL